MEEKQSYKSLQINCTSRQRKLCGREECLVCFNRSFAGQDKAKYVKDKTINLRAIFRSCATVLEFTCPKCHHDFSYATNTVSGGCFCPFCVNRQRCGKEDCEHCFKNSFAYHEKSKYVKDKSINLRMIAKHTTEVFLEFLCDKCNHCFTKPVSDIDDGKWCPFCSNKQRCDKEDCNHCFKNSFASHDYAKYVKDKSINLRTIAKATPNVSLEFLCDKCDHCFIKNIASISSKNWCPFCSNSQRCGKEDCDFCFKNSFASSDKAKYVKDKSLNLREIAISSGIKLTFTCGECSHDFDASLDHVRNGKWCAYCKNKKRCADENCVHCFNNSFASHHKAKFVKDKSINLLEIAISANKDLEFMCDKCNHVFVANVGSIVCGDNGCPFCYNRQRCLEEDCKHCYQNSFASHPNSSYLKDKTINPRTLAKFCNDKHEFICKQGHNFSMQIRAISSGAWCPKCINKTETKLGTFLETLYTDVIHQSKKDFCKHPKTNRLLWYDFELPSTKIIIELDGMQHFTQISNWSSPEEVLERDIFKMKCAVTNGYSVIRLLQTEVLYDQFDWKQTLAFCIKIIQPGEVFYLCNNDKLYENHKLLMEKEE